jgi:hypothetical protein
MARISSILSPPLSFPKSWEHLPVYNAIQNSNANNTNNRKTGRCHFMKLMQINLKQINLMKQTMYFILPQYRRCAIG